MTTREQIAECRGLIDGPLLPELHEHGAKRCISDTRIAQVFNREKRRLVRLESEASSFSECHVNCLSRELGKGFLRLSLVTCPVALYAETFYRPRRISRRRRLWPHY